MSAEQSGARKPAWVEKYRETGWSELQILRLRVTRWVNWHRERMGLPWTSLPKGNLRDPEACPVARAFAPRGGKGHVWVDSSKVIHRRPFKTWRTPPHVREFLLHFDDGEYPELIRND